MMKRILHALTFLLVATTAHAQIPTLGQYTLNRKTATAFAADTISPNGTNLLTWNGSGRITQIPRLTFLTPAQAAALYQPLNATLTALSLITTTGYGRGFLSLADAAAARTYIGAGTGTGSVTSVSVTTANGVSGSVATATTTPAITLTLGAITPTSVAASGNVTGLNLSGTNTGDQTLNGLLPSQSGNNGKFLKTNGSNASWQNLLSADITDASEGGFGTGDAGKVVLFGNQGQLLGVSTTSLSAITGNAEGNGDGVHGFSADGTGGYFESTNGQAFQATNTNATEDIGHFEHAGAGLHIKNDGGLDWTSATGVATTLNNLGVSAFVQTTLDDADAATFRATIGAGTGSGTVTSVSGTSPIASTGGTTPDISIANAAADGSTKGAASFTAADFNASSGNISLDYTNAQKATSSVPGLLTAADWTTFNGKQAAGNYITGLAGDGSATGPGGVSFTLATVNSNTGSFGSATAAPSFTVNAKGLITAASTNTITPAVGSITGLGTGVATALAVNTGSAGAFVVNGGALGTPSSGTATNLTGTASGLTAGTVTTNANLTGPITSVGNATTVADAEGAALFGLTSAANKGIQFTGSGTASTYDLTTTGKALLDDASTAAQRSTLALHPVTITPIVGGSIASTSTLLVDVTGSTITLPDTGWYEFHWFIYHSAAATSTGAWYSVNTTGTLATDFVEFRIDYDVLSTDKSTYVVNGFNAAIPSTSSRSTGAVNKNILEGVIHVTTAGAIILRFATEVGASAITITDLTGYYRNL